MLIPKIYEEQKIRASMYEQHLQDVYSYTRQRYFVKECKNMNAEKEYHSTGEKIETHETCILP